MTAHTLIFSRRHVFGQCAQAAWQTLIPPSLILATIGPLGPWLSFLGYLCGLLRWWTGFVTSASAFVCLGCNLPIVIIIIGDGPAMGVSCKLLRAMLLPISETFLSVSVSLLARSGVSFVLCLELLMIHG